MNRREFVKYASLTGVGTLSAFQRIHAGRLLDFVDYDGTE